MIFFPSEVSYLALGHGLRPDWRYEAPQLARFFNLGVPNANVPPPYLSEWLMKHPIITNPEVLHR